MPIYAHSCNWWEGEAEKIRKRALFSPGGGAVVRPQTKRRGSRVVKHTRALAAPKTTTPVAIYAPPHEPLVNFISVSGVSNGRHRDRVKTLISFNNEEGK